MHCRTPFLLGVSARSSCFVALGMSARRGDAQNQTLTNAKLAGSEFVRLTNRALGDSVALCNLEDRIATPDAINDPPRFAGRSRKGDFGRQSFGLKVRSQIAMGIHEQSGALKDFRPRRDPVDAA